jgi:hypothetical protein
VRPFDHLQRVSAFADGVFAYFGDGKLDFHVRILDFGFWILDWGVLASYCTVGVSATVTWIR